MSWVYDGVSCNTESQMQQSITGQGLLPPGAAFLVLCAQAAYSGCLASMASTLIADCINF